jgi:hypothetical protein
MNTKLKIINAAFDALRLAFDNETINWANRLLYKCKEEEREHRGVLPDFNRYHTADTIGVTQAAKLFAVKRLAEYLTGHDYPRGKDYLHFQRSCFIAAGIVDEFREKVHVAWQKFNLSAIESLDYTDFVKTRSTEAA